MFNRARAIDEKFVKSVDRRELPKPMHQSLSTELTREEIVDLFETQVMSRHLDIMARELKAKGECFYTIGSSGHEGNAAVAKAFRVTDPAFLHYRSGAFFIQRSKQLEGSTPLYDLMLSLACSSEEPIAGGRHKVFGSLPLMIPPQTSTIASHLPKAVGAAIAIGRTQKIGVSCPVPHDSVVMVNFGDASANHSTAVGAINSASWVAHQHMPMPIVFVCEDNGIGISTKTPDNWIQSNFSTRADLAYLYCDGLNILDVYAKARQAVDFARSRRRPVFLHMRTVRLLGHAGSDVESVYHSMKKIEATEAKDPLLSSAAILLEYGLLEGREIIDIYRSVRSRMEAIAQVAIRRPRLTEQAAVRESVVSCADVKKAPPLPEESRRPEIFGREWAKVQAPQHMAKLINYALTDLMQQYGEIVVFGEDVAQKGGVYNVTEELLTRFGRKRVFNSLLDEQTILGGAIGFSQMGLLPIPEIQFLAYVHNAEDQIRGEAATQAFFSRGQFTNPMVIRIAGLAYQKGFGGHFHNDNSLAVFRDIPGLIIAVPSNGADAAMMLRRCVREAHENGRVCIFVEPIARYMSRDLYEDGDKKWCFDYPSPDQELALGEWGEWDEGKELAIVTYGNGTYYSLQANKELGGRATIIDLRWIAPFEGKKLAERLAEFDKVLVVEECRKTGSFGEQVITAIVEHSAKPPKIGFHAADDCFIPLGVAAAIGLPSKDSIAAAAKELLQ